MSWRGRGEGTMGWTTRGRAWEWRQSWFLVFFLSYLLYWVPLLYMGLRALHARWIVHGVLYALPFAGWLLARQASAGALEAYLFKSLIAFWTASLIHVWQVRGEFLVRLSEAEHEREDLMAAARGRLEAEDASDSPMPQAAPPRRLLDANRANEVELAMLPGMGPERAKQAVAMRAQRGFASFDDLAERLQLPAQQRERLRALFQAPAPRTAPAPDDPAWRTLADGRRVLELNWAGLETLAALPELGAELARRTVALREADGPFKSLEDFRYRLGLSVDAMIRLSETLAVTSLSTRAGLGAKPAGRVVDV